MCIEAELSRLSKSLGLSVLFAIPVISLRAQTFRSTGVTAFPRFRLSRGNVDSAGLPISGAKLCLLRSVNVCYQMPSNTGYSSGSIVYNYGLDPRSERLFLNTGGSFVFFSAQFSGGGSGTLDSLSILEYESGGKIVNLLPFVGVTNQSERAVWSVPEVSRFPILVTADFDWMDGETHFSRHFYTVSAYCFSIKNDRYVKAFSYRTSKKYAGLDETNQVQVLNPEREEILQRLQKF